MIQVHQQESPAPLAVTIGNSARREFADTLRWLRAHTQLLTCDSADACVQYLQSAAAEPALIVWLQSYLGQFNETDVALVRAVNSCARMICVFGALSEGELRTGKPLPGVIRIPWFAWEARVQPTWEENAPPVHHGRASQAKPESPTTPRRHPADSTGEPRQTAVVGVASSCQEMAHLIISACHTAGHLGHWIDHQGIDHLGTARRPGEDPPDVDVAIWDDSSDARHPVISIETLAQKVAPAPIIAAMSFPRIDDQQWLSRYGVKNVLGKPFMIEDLLWQINALIKARRSVTAG